MANNSGVLLVLGKVSVVSMVCVRHVVLGPTSCGLDAYSDVVKAAETKLAVVTELVSSDGGRLMFEEIFCRNQ